MLIDASNKKENHNGFAVNSMISSESKLGFISPEPVSKNTFLASQYDREGRQLYTCYHPDTHHVTVRQSFISNKQFIHIYVKYFISIIYFLYIYI